VGEDQLQHLELAREIARAFNTRYGRSAAASVRDAAATLLTEPESMVVSQQSRIMSLRNPGKKMSKSDPDPDSRIDLTDSADIIAAKIKRAVTDSSQGWHYDPAAAPGKSNLMTIMAGVTQRSIADVEGEYASASAAAFKTALTDAIVARIVPIGEAARGLLDARGGDGSDGALAPVDAALEQGAVIARGIAQDTMQQVRAWVGMSAAARASGR